MEIVTTRFGTLNVEDERVIDFPKGLLGFPDRTRYALIQTGEDWLVHLTKEQPAGNED